MPGIGPPVFGGVMQFGLSTRPFLFPFFGVILLPLLPPLDGVGITIGVTSARGPVDWVGFGESPPPLDGVDIAGGFAGGGTSTFDGRVPGGHITGVNPFKAFEKS